MYLIPKKKKKKKKANPKDLPSTQLDRIHVVCQPTSGAQRKYSHFVKNK